MKNKGVIYILISIILIIIVCFFCLIKYNSVNIDENLLNKKWYHYNYSTGYYDTFYMDKNGLSYNLIDDTIDYSSCKKYSYNKSSNVLNLDCNKKIKINEVNLNNITLTIDSKKVMFFDNIDDSLNYEFESYYLKSISEVKKEMSRVSELIKIKPIRFIELLNTDEYSKIVFYGNNCSSVDCVLALNVIEKWINISENVHYANIDDFTADDLNKINKINPNFSVDKNYYNGIYPRVLIVKNKDIIKDYEIKCNGFDCSLYGENEF